MWPLRMHCICNLNAAQVALVVLGCFLYKFVLRMSINGIFELPIKILISPFASTTPISYKKLCYRKEDSVSVVLS